MKIDTHIYNALIHTKTVCLVVETMLRQICISLAHNHPEISVAAATDISWWLYMPVCFMNRYQMSKVSLESDYTCSKENYDIFKS